LPPRRDRKETRAIAARAAARPAALATAMLVGATSVAAAAAQHPASGQAEAIFFAELGLLLVVGRALGELMQRSGQPAVMGQLLGGLLLGPSVLGLIAPDLQHALFPQTAEQKSMIAAVSQLGILLLLLLTGMETDLRLVRRVGKSAITIAAAGVALPFVCGFALGEMLPDSILPNPNARLVTALFLATALSISSIKIVAVVVREMNFMRRDVGQIIVASAILEDTTGWIIIAISFGIASSGTADFRSVSFAILGTLLFLAVSLTAGRHIVFALIRWANDNFISEFPVITVILLIMIAMALMTYLIGVQTALGAFVAGILIGESPILTRHIGEQLRGLIAALFMPVFFGLSGLSADLTILKDPQLLLLGVGLIAIASFGKFSGAFVGGKLGGLSGRESLALAAAMNARGSTEVIVASIGLSMGVFSQNLFTLIVAMAVITTLAMPPMLRWALRRLPLRRAERQRLEREELDARGFVPNPERLLLAVHGSANGAFASRLAGVIALAGGSEPIGRILVPVNGTDVSRRAAEVAFALARSGGSRVSALYVASGRVRAMRRSEEAVLKDIVELADRYDARVRTALRVDTAAADAILEEATRGSYDLIVLGVARRAGETLFFGNTAAAVLERCDTAILFVAS